MASRSGVSPAASDSAEMVGAIPKCSRTRSKAWSKRKLSIESQLYACGRYGDSWTNKPTKHDGGGSGLISPLHNADKASTVSPIG